MQNANRLLPGSVMFQGKIDNAAYQNQDVHALNAKQQVQLNAKITLKDPKFARLVFLAIDTSSQSGS